MGKKTRRMKGGRWPFDAHIRGKNLRLTENSRSYKLYIQSHHLSSWDDPQAARSRSRSWKDQSKRKRQWKPV